MSENGNSKKREETAARIIAAISESNGLLTLAAKKAGIGYSTVWRYTQDFPTVKQSVTEAKERMLDFAEGKLYEKIKSFWEGLRLYVLRNCGSYTPCR